MSIAVLGVGVLCPGGFVVARLADGGIYARNMFPEERCNSLAHKDRRHVGDTVP